MCKINGKYKQDSTENLRRMIDNEDSITKRHHLILKYLGQRNKQIEQIIANIDDDDIDTTLVIEQLWEDLQLARKHMLNSTDRLFWYMYEYKHLNEKDYESI